MYFNSLEIVSQCRTWINQSKLDCFFINREVAQRRLAAQMEDSWWYRVSVVRMSCIRILSIQKILCKLGIVLWGMGASKIGDRINRCRLEVWSIACGLTPSLSDSSLSGISLPFSFSSLCPNLTPASQMDVSRSNTMSHKGPIRPEEGGTFLYKTYIFKYSNIYTNHFIELVQE